MTRLFQNCRRPNPWRLGSACGAAVLIGGLCMPAALHAADKPAAAPSAQSDASGARKSESVKSAPAKPSAKAIALSKDDRAASVTSAAAPLVLSGKAGAIAERAQKGDPHAQYHVGSMFNYGRGVKQNRQAAYRWFDRAARKRLAGAHYKIGVMYLTGDLGAPDIVEAYARFRIAAAGGDVRAAAMIFYVGPRMNAAELKKSERRYRDLSQSATTATADSTNGKK